MGLLNKKVGLIEEYGQHYANNGLLVRKSVVDLELGLVPVRIMDLNSETARLHKNTVFATCEGVDVANVKSVVSSRVVTVNADDCVPVHLNDVYGRIMGNINEEESVY